MALFNCPECGSEVSSSAASCPKCGFPIAQMTLAASADPYALAKERKWARIKKGLLVGAFLVLVGSAILRFAGEEAMLVFFTVMYLFMKIRKWVHFH
jgi:uncharacterized membrane protein YvbJ